MVDKVKIQRHIKRKKRNKQDQSLLRNLYIQKIEPKNPWTRRSWAHSLFNIIKATVNFPNLEIEKDSHIQEAIITPNRPDQKRLSMIQHRTDIKNTKQRNNANNRKRQNLLTQRQTVVKDKPMRLSQRQTIRRLSSVIGNSKDQGSMG